MLKNNVKALTIHIFVNIISVLLYYMLVINVGVAEWVSEAAYKAHVDKMVIIGLVIALLAFALYFIGGRLFLRDQGRIWKNVLSVSSVFFLGFIWWLMILPLSNLEVFSKANVWQTFSIYTSYMLTLIDYLEADIPILLLLCLMLSTLFMVLGIKKKG
ncbi:MAG: hypothetical protein LCH34_12150 [Firmicutes bacterium]|nr:hypothetical protein [Bacillota bacterium]